MHRRRRGPLLIAGLTVLLLGGQASVSAQEAPAPVTIEAYAGIGGYVDPDEPLDVVVEMTSSTLISGDLRVRVGRQTIVQKIELPAGSGKTYTVSLPAPRQSARLDLSIVPEGATEAVASLRVPLKYSTREVLVGVLEDEGLAQRIGGVTGAPFNQSIAPVVVTEADLTTRMAPLDYLVITRPVSEAAIASIRDWVAAGGRLVEATDVGSGVGLGGGDGVPLPRTDVFVFGVGRGEVVVVDALSAGAGPTAEEWSLILRAVPPAQLGFVDQGFAQEVEFQLIQAAGAASGSLSVNLPWLLIALIVYVLVVGPVNFVALRMVKRTDFVWITIPVISLMAVGAFWVVGRGQAAQLSVAHATVIIDDGQEQRAESGIVYVAGAEGTHTLGFPSGTSPRPLDTAGMFGPGGGIYVETSTRPDGGTNLAFELSSLGAATFGTVWEPDQLAMTVTPSWDGNKIEVAVINKSDLGFWKWGIASGTHVSVERDPLEAGATATTSLTVPKAGVRGDPWSTPIADAVMQQGENFGEQAWQRIWPLASFANSMDGDLLTRGTYFFGYTDDLAVPVSPNGNLVEVGGGALIIVVIAEPGEEHRRSPVIGEVIATDGQVEQGMPGGAAFIYDVTDTSVRYLVSPDLSADLTIKFDDFGPSGRIDEILVFNWETGAFDAVELTDPFPAASHVSPGGEVMVSFKSDRRGEMFAPSYPLSWEES